MTKPNVTLSAAEKLAQEMRELPWFESTGEPLLQGGPLVQSVESAQKVLELVSHPVPQWCQTEAGQRIHQAVREREPETWHQWNDIARSLIPLCRVVMDECILKRYPVSPCPETVAKAIQGQITWALIESTYEHIFASQLCRSLLRWYREGRFPCAWSVTSPEEFPGKLKTHVW